MTADRCQWCNDYLDGCLTSSQVHEFEEHLTQCERCAEAIRLQLHLNQQLRAYAHTIEPVRTATLSSKRPTRRRRVLALLVLAASVLIVAMSVWPSKWHQPDPPRAAGGPPEVPAKPPLGNIEQEQVESKSRTPRFRKLSTPNHIAIVEPSQDDGLTFVMLYPTIQPISKETDK